MPAYLLFLNKFMRKRLNQLKKFNVISFCFLVIFSGCGRITIVQMPISFSDERIEMTKLYINERYNITAPSISIIPKIIVLHWTAMDDFQISFNTFNQEMLENSRLDLQGAGQVNVSIHYLVDREGKIFQLMPDTLMARHVIGLNYNSIGVENVGGGEGIDNLTDDQIEANIKLVKYLVEKYPTIEYLIGHHEYREFEGHQLWLEKDENYRTKKYDPGDRFMNAVREKAKDLNLKGVEEIQSQRTKVKRFNILF
jgi:N-acetyl-anhydromuramyl-L-alanine amidase AmpD